MTLKASRAYRHCAPCANNPVAAQQRINGSGEMGSDRFRWTYRRTGSSSSTSSSTAGRRELEARLKGISSGEGVPASASVQRANPVVFLEENESKERVDQVEPGVLITFVSLPRKRILGATCWRLVRVKPGCEMGLRFSGSVFRPFDSGLRLTELIFAMGKAGAFWLAVHSGVNREGLLRSRLFPDGNGVRCATC